MRPCSVCNWRRMYALGRCRSCYLFYRRWGQDKTEAELVREGVRGSGRGWKIRVQTS